MMLGLEEYLAARPDRTEHDWAASYIAATNDDVLAAFEDLLADLEAASTLLQTLRAFRTCRESIAQLVLERARARVILRGGD